MGITIEKRIINAMMSISNKKSNDFYHCVPSIHKNKDFSKAWANKITRSGFSFAEFLSIAKECGFEVIISKGNTTISLSDMENVNDN